MKRGQVSKLGNSYLMCGDAGNPDDVAKLFEGKAPPDLVFTSPPYTATRRNYGTRIECWEGLMHKVFGQLPHGPRTQVLVNLGLIHEKGEWVSYWDQWIEWMRELGWRRFGWYILDKLGGLPGQWHGRLAPSKEFIFHFNKTLRHPNKIVTCKWGQGRHVRKNKYSKGHTLARINKNATTTAVSDKKIPDDVIRINPAGKSGATGHPAVFPLDLPLFIHAAYTNTGESIYDPFCGSGTSLLAAERGKRIGYGMEISEEYCATAVGRYRKWREKHGSLI